MEGPWPRFKHWHALTDGELIKVGIIDSGYNPRDHALAGRVAACKDFTGDPDGMIDHVGHGTQVARIIAGNGPCPGIAPAARLLIAKAADRRTAEPIAAARAIDWALEQGAHVINISLAAPSLHRAIFQSLHQAQQLGVTVICSAGNWGSNTISGYPGALTECVSVGACDHAGNPSSYSNSYHVDVYAIGSTACAADPNTPHHPAVGTSVACAVVSGLVALLQSHFLKTSGRLLRPDEVKPLLQVIAVNEPALGLAQVFAVQPERVPLQS